MSNCGRAAPRLNSGVRLQQETSGINERQSAAICKPVVSTHDASAMRPTPTFLHSPTRDARQAALALLSWCCMLIRSGLCCNLTNRSSRCRFAPRLNSGVRRQRRLCFRRRTTKAPALDAFPATATATSQPPTGIVGTTNRAATISACLTCRGFRSRFNKLRTFFWQI